MKVFLATVKEYTVETQEVITNNFVIQFWFRWVHFIKMMANFYNSSFSTYEQFIHLQTLFRHKGEADEIQISCCLEMEFSCGLANSALKFVGIFSVIQCKSVPHE